MIVNNFARFLWKCSRSISNRLNISQVFSRYNHFCFKVLELSKSWIIITVSGEYLNWSSRTGIWILVTCTKSDIFNTFRITSGNKHSCCSYLLNTSCTVIWIMLIFAGSLCLRFKYCLKWIKTYVLMFFHSQKKFNVCELFYLYLNALNLCFKKGFICNVFTFWFFV